MATALTRTRPLIRLRAAAPVLAAAAAMLVAGELRAQESSDRVGYSAHAGAGGAKAWNFVGGTAEFFPRGDHASLFVTGGLGTILVGVGGALYTNRSGHGLFASATAGLAGGHVQGGAQLRLGTRLYAVGGVSYGVFFLQHIGFLPVAALEYRWSRR